MLSSDQTNRTGQKYMHTGEQTQQLLYKYAEIYLKLGVRLFQRYQRYKCESEESTFGEKRAA